MAITPIAQPEAMRRIGGGRGSGGGDDFAGLGGSFAGPGSEFTASYLQNRISGMNRATVSPRVNQKRVMASPEFALAKTLGISTPYNSGGSQVDVQGARKTLNNPYSTRMDREYAQAGLDRFNQKAASAPLNPVLGVAGLGRASEPDYAGPVGSQGAYDEMQKRFGKPQQKIAPVPTTPGATGGGAPQPTQGAPSGDQAAAPISPQAAKDATKAPIGAELPATSGEPESRRTPTQETTKGPRLDTYRGPDGGESFRQKEKAPELAPLGGYDEKIVSGARGGNPDAKRGEQGYMEKETVAVGPMTNKPASSQAEYDQRTKAFADAGEKQKQDNADTAERKKKAGEQKNLEQLNKKYAGPGPFPKRAGA